MIRSYVLLLFIAIIAGSCKDKSTTNNEQMLDVYSHDSSEVVDDVKAVDVNEIDYSIVSETKIPDKKWSLVIRLGAKISEAELTALANAIRDRDGQHYENVYMDYLLPGMRDGQGAWATTHFSPDLNVRILGVSLEQEKSASAPAASGEQIIGRWLDEGPLGGLLTICARGDKIYFKHDMSSGESYEKELVRHMPKQDKRFDLAGDNESGDYYLIDDSGNLKIRRSLRPSATLSVECCHGQNLHPSCS